MIPKFRAWAKYEKIMSEVESIDFRSERTITKMFMESDFDDVVLMQSTGLFDKDGQEIFEGDIFTNGIDFMSIKRHNTLGFYVDFKGKIEFVADGAVLDEFEEVAKVISNNIRVVGNIYENPELLGE